MWETLPQGGVVPIDHEFHFVKWKKGRKAGHKSICMIVVLLTTITLTDTENMCLILEKEQERRLLLLRTAAGAQIVQCRYDEIVMTNSDFAYAKVSGIGITTNEG